MQTSRSRFFRVVGAINPLPFFPTKALPVFQETGVSSGQDFFMQALDDDLYVLDFQLHEELPDDVFFPLNFDGYPVRVGDVGIQIVALSPVDVYVCQGSDQLDGCLAEILEKKADNLEVLDPFFALEAAQHLHLETQEVRFAKACARRISVRSTDVATRWIDSAQLGELAKNAALRELALVQERGETTDQGEEPEIIFPSLWQSRAFSSLHHVRVPNHSIRNIFDDIADLEGDNSDLSGSLVFLHWGDNNDTVLEKIQKIQSLGAEVFSAPQPWVEDLYRVAVNEKQINEKKLREVGVKFFSDSSRKTISSELEKILQVRSRLSGDLSEG